jgi:signal transduction histidine kinase
MQTMKTQDDLPTGELTKSDDHTTPQMCAMNMAERSSYQHFNATALISEIAEATRILIGNKPVTVEVTVPALPVMITTDPVKLLRIVTNLANNAAKFIEKGAIRISLAIHGRRIEIGVSDTGVGIKEEHINKLFAAFCWSGENRTKCHEGTVIGLTATRNLRELNGGTMSVTRNEGKRTTFMISLPNDNEERQRWLYNAE